MENHSTGTSCGMFSCTTSLTKLHTPTVLIEKMGDTPLLYNFCVSACVGEWGAYFHVENFLQIEKKEVDNFEEGKRIPSCQLVATCETGRPTTLRHLVTLSGAKDPHNIFTIYRSYDSGTY